MGEWKEKERKAGRQGKAIERKGDRALIRLKNRMEKWGGGGAQLPGTDRLIARMCALMGKRTVVIMSCRQKKIEFTK